MTELYKFIIEFIKTYPERFWIGLILAFFYLTTFVIFVIIKKRKRKKEKLRQLLKIEAEKKKAEEIANKNRIKEEISGNFTRKIEEEQKENILKLVLEKSVKEPEVLKANEPDILYKKESKPIEKAIEIIKAIPKTKSIEKLPDAIKDENKEITGNLFVNYQLNFPESIDKYAVIRIPEKGCIVRSHRFGNTKRRGFKEDSFQKSIQKYFGNHFQISGEVRLNTGMDTRPFEPDIAIIDTKSGKNIRIDIEIDEPYAGITRQPTHCKGEDVIRDTYFVDRGWLVIRFSEYQVHSQEIECLKYIALILKSIDANYPIPNELNAPLNLKYEKQWDIVQAQKWEKEKYREQYLNHQFVETPEKKETDKRDFSEQEIHEEMLVKPSSIGIADNTKTIGFNKINAHHRDKRIVFYPESHVYTIDSIPVPSASTVISKFFPEFDSYGKASTLSPSNPLYGLPIEEIVEIWNKRALEAANQGTYLHEQIERFYLNQTHDETEEFHLFRQFVTDHKDINPYRTEWRIFDEKYNIAGTIDLIASNGNRFEIYDWKRSKKVVDFAGNPIKIDTWGNCGVGKLSDIPDTSYNRYCLQQSLYRYILESNYGIKISNMFLIILYPDNDRYYKVETPYWRERIEYILNAL
ncbi:MAG TPA: hypothetical protein VIH57_01120 [Bacteroidales bacterium]